MSEKIYGFPVVHVDAPPDVVVSDEHGQWDEDSTETSVGGCAWCHETRPIRKVIDPYVTEGIIDKDDPEEEWVCRPCFGRRAEDV